MKTREFLQTEIWSKETSRRILARTGKILKRVGIVFGCLAVVLGIAYAIEISWMTTGEHVAATRALNEIDALQSLVLSDGNEFDVRDRKAKETTMAAARAAWTIRDNTAAGLLWNYLEITEEDRNMVKLLAGIRADMQKRNIPWQSHPALNGQNDVQETQIRLTLRSEVLKTLQ